MYQWIYGVFLAGIGMCGCEFQSVETVDLFTTTSDRTKEFAYEIISFHEEGLKDTDLLITLDTAVRYQTMDGFGAAITGSTAYNLMRMTPENRSAFLYETFSPDRMGFSYVRISIGCSDFSLSEYTCCDKKGIEHFSLTAEETIYVIPVLKEILRINPSLKVMGSPWTCPTWMKISDLKTKLSFRSWTGGHLSPLYYGDYATYFVKWIQAFQKEGIPIYAITPQNEPLNRGNSASLYMGWREQLAFIKTALGPKFKTAGLKTKIYVFDHNFDYDRMEDQQDYPLHLYADTEASTYIAGAAYHHYSGDKSELNRIHAAYPNKELMFTEASIGAWNDGRNFRMRLLEDMCEIGLGTVNNHCKGVIVWNLMLDSRQGPKRERGCPNCYGAVDIDTTDYKTITRNSHYFVIAHLASVVKSGAVRIGIEGKLPEGVTGSAFLNPNGSYAFVVMNESSTPCTFFMGESERLIQCHLPGRSIVSYRWNDKP